MLGFGSVLLSCSSSAPLFGGQLASTGALLPEHCPIPPVLGPSSTKTATTIVDCRSTGSTAAAQDLRNPRTASVHKRHCGSPPAPSLAYPSAARPMQLQTKGPASPGVIGQVRTWCGSLVVNKLIAHAQRFACHRTAAHDAWRRGAREAAGEWGQAAGWKGGLQPEGATRGQLQKEGRNNAWPEAEVPWGWLKALISNFPPSMWRGSSR